MRHAENWFVLVVPPSEPGGSFGARVGGDFYWFTRQDDGFFVAQHQQPGGAFSPGRRYRVCAEPASCSCKGFHYRGRCRHLHALRQQLAAVQSAAG